MSSCPLPPPFVEQHRGVLACFSYLAHQSPPNPSFLGFRVFFCMPARACWDNGFLLCMAMMAVLGWRVATMPSSMLAMEINTIIFPRSSACLARAGSRRAAVRARSRRLSAYLAPCPRGGRRSKCDSSRAASSPPFSSGRRPSICDLLGSPAFCRRPPRTNTTRLRRFHCSAAAA